MKANGEQPSQSPAQAAGSAIRTWARGLVRYDAERRRLWLADQRVHHGLTGAVIATAGVAGLLSRRMTVTGTVEVALLGTLLMADDWHDRSVWLVREHAPNN